MKATVVRMLICAPLVLTLLAGVAQAQTRATTVWDLTELYPSDAAWEIERQSIAAAVQKLMAFKGTLAKDAGSLAAAMRAISDVNRRLDRLEVYSSLKRDEDTRVSANQDLQQRAELLITDVRKATSFVDPEIVAMGKAKVEQFIAADPRLAPFAFRLHKTLARADHTLGAEAENVLASAGAPLRTASNTYTLLANADLPWPTVTFADGSSHRLDSQGYTAVRDTANRDDRKKVFESFFGAWGSFKDAFGATLGGSVQGEVFRAKARKYDSGLALALAENNISDAVYRTLVTETNAGLPTLFRYYALRKKMLHVDELHYYDLYVPLVKSDTAYTPEAAEKLVLDGVAPLGRDYVATLAKGFAARWMHLLPQPGKTPGAYMNPGAYDVHPYLLINFNGHYEDVSTIAHEWGHAMHSVMADKALPYETADYPIFLAEIASTTNEMLLQDHMVATAKTPAEKLYFLNQALDLIKGTFYRQAMFAEFELRTHEAAERGEPLSGAALSRIYLQLLKHYSGDTGGASGGAAGAVKIDDAYGAEWAYIPHFYRDFYVYQYATSISAAAYFSHAIETGGDKARDTYLNVLKSGGSDYPTEILKRAGLDMTTPAPYRTLVARAGAIIDQMDALIKENGIKDKDIKN